MKYFITYFYNVRFLKPNQIPFSTAIWDPKWFHDFNSQDYIFRDKNGVVNGLRIESLHPKLDNDQCIDCDHGEQGNCGFIKKYTEQLENTNFKLIQQYLEMQAKNFNKTDDETEIILLVHEKPDNPCSERHPLRKWFEKNNILLNNYENN